MTQAKPRFTSFDEYLAHADETEGVFELFNGALIAVPPESGENISIADFLWLHFAQMLGYRRVKRQGLELEVRGEPRNRFPDLTVLRPEHIEQLQKRCTIRLSMDPPMLVIEVVSPGEIQRERDYVAKRSQYQSRGIPEYWLIDPQQGRVLILLLKDETYQEFGSFRGEEVVRSPQFGKLELTAQQILTSGSPESNGS
ncbi:Uma2 family endonuclease [Vacuolonema iberomarrocanum]|uniref:Uma2 family endonuclease n=1 Tax=Vacuolonema iberomarrocanum TaxID=3454632 RepID=UPI001A0742D9|nr:Uma2 family endonuclease [filamentous cyanobacterium LEGE 07170]